MPAKSPKQPNNNMILIVAAVAAVAIAGYFFLKPTTSSAGPDPQTILATKCSSCHAAPTAAAGSFSADQAASLVQTMGSKKGELTPEETQALIKYFTKQ